jgi:hypothetical protein
MPPSFNGSMRPPQPQFEIGEVAQQMVYQLLNQNRQPKTNDYLLPMQMVHNLPRSSNHPQIQFLASLPHYNGQKRSSEETTTTKQTRESQMADYEQKNMYGLRPVK